MIDKKEINNRYKQFDKNIIESISKNLIMQKPKEKSKNIKQDNDNNFNFVKIINSKN